MANWKKVVVSGSSAELSSLTLDTSLASGSGGTGLTKSDLAAASAGQVLAIKSDLSGFTLTTAAGGDVKAIITPANGGLSISDTSNADGNVAITMSISSLATETTLAAADTFAFNDADSTDAVTAKKITLDNLSGSIISGISGDVSVTSAGVASITDAATGSILSTLSGDVTSTVAGVASITDAATGSILSTLSGDVTSTVAGVASLANSVGVLGTNEFTGSFKGDGGDLTNISISTISDALTGSILNTIAGDVNVSTGGVSTIQDNKITDAMLQRATTGSILATLSGDVTSTVGGVATISADSVDGSKLADSITITDNLTVGGNLNVAGTASFTNATNLAVSDKYILLNSGSKDVGGDNSGGIIIQGPNQDIGQLFGFESGSSPRWGVDSNFDANSAAGFTPEAFMSAVLPAGSATTVATIEVINTRYNKNGNIYTTNDSNGNEIWIYA